MESPLTELSKQSVSTALEVNLVEHTKFYCKSPKANFNEVGEFIWYTSGLPIATLNVGIGINIESQNVKTIVKHVLSDIKKKKVPFVWWVGPSAQEKNIGRYLEKAGFTKYLDMPGMGVSIDKLEETEKNTS